MKNSALLIITISSFLWACNKDDGMIQTSLTVTTLDESGEPVEGASIELYATIDDWVNESSQLYQTLETDLEGKATFTNIDSGSYFINVYKETMNNWESGVLKSVIDGFENKTNITINENGSGYLSMAPGKKWVMNSFLNNGGDYFEFVKDCIKDDTLIFYKGPTFGAYVSSSGPLKCSVDQLDNAQGLWTLSDNNSHLQIQLGIEIINWNIDTLKVDKLSVSYVESGNIQKVGYIPID